MMDNKTNATLREKVGYGFGDLASSMFWKIFAYFIPFFYVDVFGLEAGHAFALILLTKIYDAVSDPLMGMIADRTDTKWGKYRPYLLWVAVPFAIIGTLTFYTPDFSYSLKLVYAYVTYILLMSAYTAVNVPYGAMLGVVSRDAHEKSVFASYRMFFAYVGSFVSMGLFAWFEQSIIGTQRIIGGVQAVDAAGEPVLITSIKEAQPSQITTIVAVAAVLSAIFFILSFLMTKEHVKVQSDKSEKGSIKRDLKALAKNTPWWTLTLASILLLVVGSMRGGAMPYFFSNILGGSALFGSVLFLTIGEIAQLLGVTIAVPVSEKLGRKTSIILCLGAIGLFSLFVAFVPSTPAGFWMFFVLHLVVCIFIGLISPLLWTMFSDVADYSELKNKSMSTGLIFSSSSMAQKFGSAFGSALVAGVLGLAGYEAGVAENSESINSAVRGLMSWLPAIVAGLGIVSMLFYTLTTDKMKQIRAELAASKQ